MTDSQRIEILNMLVADLLTNVSTLATELQNLKEEIQDVRNQKRSE